MKRVSSLFLCAMVFTLSAAIVFADSEVAEQTGIIWEDDFAKALEKAKETDKIIMVDVSTSWCGYCVKLDEETFSHPDVVALAEEFVCLRVDGDNLSEEFKELYSKEIQGFPTILFISKQGAHLLTSSGFMPAEPYLSMMSNVLRYNDIQSLEEQYYKEGDTNAGVQLLDIYITFSWIDNGLPLLEELAAKKAIDNQREASAYVAVWKLLRHERRVCNRVYERGKGARQSECGDARLLRCGIRQSALVLFP